MSFSKFIMNAKVLSGRRSDGVSIELKPVCNCVRKKKFHLSHLDGNKTGNTYLGFLEDVELCDIVWELRDM